MAVCPICARPRTLPDFQPFCSARCKQVDLSRWLGEVYRIPVSAADEESPDTPAKSLDNDPLTG